MQKETRKRLVSLMLSFILAAGMFPATVMARQAKAETAAGALSPEPKAEQDPLLDTMTDPKLIGTYTLSPIEPEEGVPAGRGGRVPVRSDSVPQEKEDSFKAFALTEVSEITAEDAQITLYVPEDVWDDGGNDFQLYLDPTCTIVGEYENLRNAAEWEAWLPTLSVKSQYKIPTNAVSSPTGHGIRPPEGNATITIPAGSYDFMITNPVSDGNFKGFYITDEGYNYRSGFDFQAGKRYVFTVVNIPANIDIGNHYEMGITDYVDLGVAEKDGKVLVTGANPFLLCPRIDRVPETETHWSAYSGSVSWTPNDRLFSYDTYYVAHFDLKARRFFEFDAASELTITPDGADDVVNVVRNGDRLTFDALYAKTYDMPAATTTVLAQDVSGAGFVCLVGFDPTETMLAKAYTQRYINMERDFDYWVPENYGEVYLDYGYFVGFSYNGRVPADTGYDWGFYAASAFYGYGFTGGGNIYIRSDRMYLFETVYDGSAFVCYVYEGLPNVTGAVSRPGQLTKAGGKSAVTFTGVMAIGMPVEIYRDGFLVTEPWATGLVTEGSPVSQSFNIIFPANTTGLDQVYTIKLAGQAAFATVTVSGSVEPVTELAAVKLNVPSAVKFGDGGYQLIMDSTHTAFANNSPNNYQDYANYDIYIPANADEGLTNYISGGVGTAGAPSGVYDIYTAARYYDPMPGTPPVQAPWYDQHGLNDVTVAYGHTYEYKINTFAVGNTITLMPPDFFVDGVNVNTIGTINAAVTAPVAGAAPQTQVVETALYTGTITWLPDGTSPEKFGYKQTYTAHVVLTDKAGSGFITYGNDFKVNGGLVENLKKDYQTVSFDYTFPMTGGKTGATQPDPNATVTIRYNTTSTTAVGIQALFDSTHTACDNAAESSTSYKIRSLYDYGLPPGALGLPGAPDRDGYASYVPKNTSGSVSLPPGTYDIWMVTVMQSGSAAPDAYRAWYYNDYVFEAGYTYSFVQSTDAAPNPGLGTNMPTITKTVSPAVPSDGGILTSVNGFVNVFGNGTDFITNNTSNGEIIARFDDVPNQPAKLSDYTVEYEIKASDNTTVTTSRRALPITSFYFDGETDAIFTFDVLGATGDNITIWVKHHGIEKSWSFVRASNLSPNGPYTTVTAAAGGSIENNLPANGQFRFASGGVFTLRAAAEPGHVFDGWYRQVGSEWVKQRQAFDFTDVNGAKETDPFAGPVYRYSLNSAAAPGGLTLEARFISVRAIITASAGAGGSVTGGGEYDKGAKVTLTASAASGYAFRGWYENDLQVSGAYAAYTFTATGHRTLEARFSAIEVPGMAVITATAGVGGTAAGGGQFATGATVRLTAAANAGYKFDGWYEDGEKVSGAMAVYSFTAYKNRELEARFLSNTVMINVVAAGNGDVTGGGTYSVGEMVTLAASPDNDWVFDGWYQNGVKLFAGLVYTLTASADITLEARFIYSPGVITITVYPTSDGTVTGGGEYAPGDTVTLTAEPDPGCVFAGWYENGLLVCADKVYEFTATVNRTLSAIFWSDKVHISAGTGGLGTVEGEGYYIVGDEVTLTAAPISGYKFGGWYEDGVKVSSQAVYSLTAETHKTLEARFVPISDNTKLASLTIAQGALTPAFDPDIEDYTVTVGYSVLSDAITAETASDEADVEIAGPGTLAVGDNLYLVVVTAKNGAVQTYTVTVVRAGGEIVPPPSGGGTAYYPPYTGQSAPAVTVAPPTNPAGPVTPGYKNPYADVHEGDWFYNAVQFVTENNIMAGTGDGKFEPNTGMTRAMFAQILYNYAGKPEVDGDNPFDDVADGQWYTDAIIWAAEEGIVSGYGDAMFGPNDLVTREQMIVIFCNYAVSLGIDVSAAADLSGYNDADEISEWALSAVEWAVAEGVISGTSAVTLEPKSSATRAQAAALFKNFVELIIDREEQ